MRKHKDNYSNKAKKIKVAGLIAATFVLIFVLIANSRRLVPGTKSKLSAAQAGAGNVPDTRPVEKKAMPEEIKDLLSSVGRQDPFVVSSSSQGTVPEGKTALVGIIGGESATAIFNDTIVAEGDFIAGRKVLEIQKDSVILQDESGNITVGLGQSLP